MSGISKGGHKQDPGSAKSAIGAARAAMSAAGRAIYSISSSHPVSSRNKIIQKLLPTDFTPKEESIQEDFNQILGRRQLW